MGNVGGKAQPKKSTNLTPTIQSDISFDNAKPSVAKYKISAIIKA
jgi:hypothetical protein